MECASLVSTHLSGSSLTWEPCLLGECMVQFDFKLYFIPLKQAKRLVFTNWEIINFKICTAD